MKAIGPYLKTIGTFLAALVANIIYRVTQDAAPLPALDDGKGWLMLGLTVLGSTVAAFATPNPGYIRPNKDQTVVVADKSKGQGLPPLELPGNVNAPEVLSGSDPGPALPVGGVGPAGVAAPGRHARRFRLRR